MSLPNTLNSSTDVASVRSQHSSSAPAPMKPTTMKSVPKTRAAKARTPKKRLSKKTTTSVPRVYAHVVALQGQRWLVVADDRSPQDTAWCAAAALAQTGRIYRMAGQPVELIERKDLSACDIRTLDVQGMSEVLTRWVECVAWDSSLREFKPGPSADKLASLILTYRPLSALPVLTGVVVGSNNLSSAKGPAVPGYDPTTGLYVVSAHADPAAYKAPELTGDPDLDELIASLGR